MNEVDQLKVKIRELEIRLLASRSARRQAESDLEHQKSVCKNSSELLKNIFLTGVIPSLVPEPSGNDHDD